MNDLLNNRIFKIIAESAEELNIPAYIVGGYVRDMIMHRPSKDIDIVAVGSGIELAQHVAARLGKSIGVTVYRNFGTAMIKYHDRKDEWIIEFVGARKESYNWSSRKPVVETGTLEDDQNRRDFSINALAISLQWNNIGTLIDPFNGLKDIENRIIRTPLDPDITFSDDPLRMMRAIRFSTQLNFHIEDKTLYAIKRNHRRISIVSMERITDELNKIILAVQPSIGFNLLFKTGLLDIIFPQFVALKGTEFIDGKGHKDNFFHSLEVLDKLAPKTENLWLRWAALLHDIGKPLTKKYDPEIGWTFYGHDFIGSRMVEQIFKMLRLPQNEKMKYVEKLVLLHLRPQVLTDEGVTDSAVRRLLFDTGDAIDDLMLLCEADITSKNQQKVARYLDNFAFVRQKLVEVEEKDRIRNWQPPVSGEIIMETFNLNPSKEVGIIKSAIREAILDGIISNTFEDAYRLMLEVGQKIGLKQMK